MSVSVKSTHGATEGALGDKTSELIREALSRAAQTPSGLPLHGGRRTGLFTNSAAAKKAAQVCKSEGYLEVLSSEARGRGTREICSITQKGLAYLFLQVSPKHALRDLVQVLHSQQSQIGELLKSVGQWQVLIDSFKNLVDQHLLHGDRNGSLHFAPAAGDETSDHEGMKREPPGLRDSILWQLSQWHESGDCPLPELFRRCSQDRFTIGQFHDELRRLHQQEQIYLHPWTGPLSEIPEPAFALLAGHGIAYYASRRFPCP
jgi:hypothetical protein